MKRTLLFSFLIGSLSAIAQITVTATDVATIGFVVKQANDTLPTVLPGPSGASQTWNFTNLNNHVVDTLTFTNPNWLPNGSSFPTSNLAVKFGSNGDAYLNLSSTALMILGQAGDFGFGPMVIDINPDDQLMKFPATMGTNFMNTSKFTLSFPFPSPPVDSARIKNTTTKRDTVDAWGTVTTPLVPNLPSIRVKELNVSIDSFFVHAFSTWNFFSRTIDTEYVYSWWVNNTSNLYGFPLVEIRTDSSMTVTGANYLMASPTQTGMAESNIHSIPAYPNPASEVITFLAKGLDVEILCIMDATGREVKRIAVTGDVIKVNVSDLSAGAYYYVAFGPGNAMKKAGKFSVSK